MRKLSFMMSARSINPISKNNQPSANVRLAIAFIAFMSAPGERQPDSGYPGMGTLTIANEGACLESRHVGKEVGVGLGLAQLVDQQFHRFHRGQRVQHLTQYPDAGKII